MSAAVLCFEDRPDLIRSVCLLLKRGRPPGCCRPVRQQHTAEEGLDIGVFVSVDERPRVDAASDSLKSRCWMTLKRSRRPRGRFAPRPVARVCSSSVPASAGERASALRGSDSRRRRCPLSSISALSLSVTGVPARSRTQRLSSSTTSASCNPGSPWLSERLPTGETLTAQTRPRRARIPQRAHAGAASPVRGELSGEV